MKAQVKLKMEQEDERSSIQARQSAEQNEVREGKHTNGVMPDVWIPEREERGREEVTENNHQKSYRVWWRPGGWAYRCCMEVFLLGAGTLGVSSPFLDPLILSRESSSGRRPNGF